MDFEDIKWFYSYQDAVFYYLFSQLIYKNHIRFLKLKGDEKILDFGCGGGASSIAILKKISKNGHLICLDISDFCIKKAKNRLEKYPNVDFINDDIKNNRLPDESFDVITIMYTLHDIEKGERQHVLSILCSKLKKGGKLLILEPTKEKHGIPLIQMKKLIKENNLKEDYKRIKRNVYFGIFLK